jgi:uncharacterized protein
VKLLIREPGSDQASSLVASATELISASIGYVEARSALGKAARAGRLSRSRQGIARAELHEIWAEMTIVNLDEELVTAAGNVTETRRLGAGDAIHLTAALVVDEPLLVFATWDEALRSAAREVGLAVAP